MRKQFLLRSVYISILAIFVIAGCAPSIRTPIMKPAEINLRGIDKIVIGDIDGNVGRSFGDLLTTRLFESQKYEVLDRDNLDRIMQEHQLNASGAVDPGTAVKMGKVIGASALVAGNVNMQYDVKRWKGEGYKDKEGKYHQSYNVKGIAKINANLKVIGLTTGKVLAVKSISTEASDSDWENLQWPSDPDRDSLVAEAASEALDKFMKMIAPYTAYVSVNFESTKTPEGKSGIEMAKNGLWNDALEQFKLAKDKNPADAGAWYNLGVAYQYNYMFRQAEDAFKECNKIKVNDKCVQGLGNIKEMEEEQKKLEQQGVNVSGT